MLWLGGMSTPWQALATVTAVEKSAGKPALTIIGISREPREETSATAEPEIPPKNILARIFTWDKPPRNLPTRIFAKFNRRSAIPPTPIISPARMKNGMAIKEKLLIALLIC
jgi:hypothetical protein